MPARRILILSSSTGGGHDMRAEALKQWLLRLCGSDIMVFRWQALEESSSLDRFGVTLYNWIQKYQPRAHHLYFNFLEIAGLHKNAQRLRGRARLASYIRETAPDIVVSTHAHLNHGYFEAIRRAIRPKKVRCLTYCGELHGGYGFSRHWVNPQADGFIAAVPACADAARSLGMPVSRIHTGGFLLDPSFYEAEESASADLFADSSMGTNKALGDDTQSLPRPRILLGTGANGANNHAALLRQLPQLKTPISVIALCGRNEKAIAPLKTMPLKPHDLLSLGYRKDMARILRQVDLAFIRPGTGTTSECIRTGCPVLFNGIGGLMPQEGITVRFLESMGLDPIVVRHPKDFIPALKTLLSSANAALKRQRDSFREINAGLSPAGIVEEILR